jgi:hypothetical protein
MNRGSIKPADSPDKQEIKRRLWKNMFFTALFIIVCLVLINLLFILNYSHTISIVVITVCGLCVSLCYVFSLNVQLLMRQKSTGMKPSKEQLQKKKMLSIALVIFITVVFFIASFLFFPT